MAKWGEGDPRWIVEERPDATNVNNWHWTEKNATPWSKDKLKLLLQDFVVAGSGQEAKVVEIEKMDGEATANNRKGKLIFFYEWNIVLKWKGVCDDEDVTGKVTVSYFFLPYFYFFFTNNPIYQCFPNNRFRTCPRRTTLTRSS